MERTVSRLYGVDPTPSTQRLMVLLPGGLLEIDEEPCQNNPDERRRVTLSHPWCVTPCLAVPQ
jgi:hypothetical protein